MIKHLHFAVIKDLHFAMTVETESDIKSFQAECETGT
jgi:hypothetical protein